MVSQIELSELQGRYAPLRDGVAEALQQLGGTPNEVATSLAKLNIKGRSSSAHCPIANYLRAKGFVDPNVGESIIYVDLLDDNGQLCDLVSCDVPTAVADFITAFDRAIYRDLMLFAGKPDTH